MSVNRRVFIRQLSIGSVVLPFWVDDLWARECNKPDPNQDCILPTPGNATQLVPNEPKVVTRYSASRSPTRRWPRSSRRYAKPPA